MKTAIFLYDLTGIMAKPWIQSGYKCFCFDGQHPEGVTDADTLHVKVGMWLENDEDTLDKIIEIVGDDSEVRFVFGFPECTDLAVSGAVHFAKKLAADPECQTRATERAKFVQVVADHWNAPWGVENPVSVLATLWRKPDFNFHPYEYGGYLAPEDVHPLYPDYIAPRDAYPKKTCIWCGNGFVIPPKNSIIPEEGFSRQHKLLGGKSLKTKNIRSATPRGFAEAVHLSNGLISQ